MTEDREVRHRLLNKQKGCNLRPKSINYKVIEYNLGFPFMVETLLDPTAFRRLHKLGGDNLVLKMIDSSESNLNTRLDEALAGWKKGEIEAIERGAHSIKSSAGNIGADSLMAKAAELEGMAERKETEGIERLLEEITKIFDSVKLELSIIKGELGG